MQIIILNLKPGKDNTYLLVQRFGCILYRPLQCNLVTDNTADAVAWAFTT